MARIALLQLQLQENTEKLMEHVTRLLSNADAAEADIVCLPEQWYPKNVQNFEQEFKVIMDIAKEYDTTIIAGAFLETVRKNTTYISCPVIGSNGAIQGRQFKIHPFGDERSKVKAGSKVEIFTSKKYKFGVAICHDVVFPEVSRAITLKGADMIFYPSRIREDGIEPWHLYVQVRSLENRVPVAAPNICGKQYGGKSMIVDFEYNEKNNIALPRQALASVNEQILVMDIDVENARRIRRVRLEDIKTELYKTL
ncbi:MAG: carbon-nitrogen hydrolase family protein [Nitrososphaerales archaeon]